VSEKPPGLNKLLISLTENYPGWGGLIIDPKSVYWRTVHVMLETAGRAKDLAVLRIRSPKEAEENYHPVRFNLIGDPSVPCSTDEQCAKQSAEFIGKRMVNKRSRSIGSRGATYSYQETEDYKLKPWQLRQMPFTAPCLSMRAGPGNSRKFPSRC
jgi:hypothetical protein